MLKKSLPYIILILVFTFGFGLFPDSIKTREALSQADRLYKDGNPEAALKIYNELFRLYPNLDYLYSKAGIAAYKIGDNELAMYYLEKADMVNLLTDEGKLTLGDLYLSLGDGEKAERTWTHIKNNAFKMELVTQRLIDLGIKADQWEKVKSDLEFWIKDSPDNDKPRELLGWVDLFLKPQDALPIFQALETTHAGIYQKIIDQISLFPATDDDMEGLAAWWIKTGDLMDTHGMNQLSMKAYGKSIEAAPENALGWAKLALEKQKSNLDGSAEVNKALKNGANDPLVNNLIADYWEKSGQPELSLIYLHKVIELDSKNTYAMNRIGWLLADIGGVDDGIGYIKRSAIILNSSEGWMNVIQYCLTNEVKIREEAIPATRKAISISPDDPEVLDLAGQVFFSQDDLVTSERYFLKAVSLNNDFFAAHLHLAYVYIKQSQFIAARGQLTTAIEQQFSPEIREKAIKALALLPVE